MGQNVAIVILFILVAVGAYAFYKHKKDTNAHKIVFPSPTVPSPIVGGPADGKPPVERK